MSTPRIPPVPPNKAGELDKSAPTEHRKVEKVEKVSKISEVDDESRARQKFRQFVDAEEEVPSDLPSPFALFSAFAEEGPPAGSMLKSSLSEPKPPPAAPESQFRDEAEAAVPSPPTSPPPSTQLANTSIEDEEEAAPPALPRSQQFWENVENPADLSETPPDRPQFQETPRSSSRVFGKSQKKETGKNLKAEEGTGPRGVAGPFEKKKGGPFFERETPLEREASPFGPPGKPGLSKRERGEPFSSAAARREPGSGMPPKREARDEREARASWVGKGRAEEIPSYPLALPQEPKKEKKEPFAPEWGPAERDPLSREKGKIAERKTEGVIKREGGQYVGPLPSEPKEMSKTQMVPHLKEEEARSTSGSPLPEETEMAPYPERLGNQPARAWVEEEGKRLSAQGAEEAKKEKKPGAKVPLPAETGLVKREEAFLEKDHEGSGGGKKKRREERVEEPLQIESPTLTPLPEAVLPAAAAAAAAATPFLGPEALAVYFHMVGTITAMVSPKGDSRTEFVLNAPSFAQSKFYGATISIERFSTAPYQLNIRLTGSNEAVTLFNQNVPNLLAAFQNGKFNYAINRIEAVYERPLFRRKEEAGGKGDRGFGGGEKEHKRR